MVLKGWLFLVRLLSAVFSNTCKLVQKTCGKFNVFKITIKVLLQEPTVAIEFSGDLGSQLFQWAAARSLFRSRNIRFFADISDFHFFKKNQLRLHDVGIDLLHPPNVVFLKKLCEYWSPFLDKISVSRWPFKILEASPQQKSYETDKYSNYLVSGYWRNPFFADNVREDLMLDIKLPVLPNELNNILQSICQEPVFICSDQSWVQDEDLTIWYQRALNVSQKSNLVVLCLRAENKLVSHEYIDLSVQSQAIQLHFISRLNYIFLTPSLVGWWGVWLNNSGDKKAYCPKDWNLLSGDISKYRASAWQEY